VGTVQSTVPTVGTAHSAYVNKFELLSTLKWAITRICITMGGPSVTEFIAVKLRITSNKHGTLFGPYSKSVKICLIVIMISLISVLM
jgi:hypothetical protein